MQNPAWIPEIFRFVLIEDTVNIPLIFQILILELAIDGLRLAALNTPSMLSTPLSVIAGIVMGEFSVESGWFNSEIMLYMAFVSIANYTQPNFELGYGIKIHASSAPYPHRHLQPPRIPHRLPHRHPLHHLQQNPIRP